MENEQHPLHQTSPEASRLYFILAIAALLIAGDLVWWQNVQLADSYNDYFGTAVIAPYQANTVTRDNARLQNDLSQINTDLPEQDFKAIDQQINSL